MSLGEKRSVVVGLSRVGVSLAGDLLMPPAAIGLVVFVHGSGSSRHSPRNRAVASMLHEAAIATLLMDLLTVEEELLDRRTAELRFDVPLLTRRVEEVIAWSGKQVALGSLSLGLFGASTGAAAALVAAAEVPEEVRAVVARGGRPDLAGSALSSVSAPTLLIVGGRDDAVLELNERALEELRGPRLLEIVPGATHLFEEPGALEKVGALAVEWFSEHLSPGRRAVAP